MPTNDWFPQQRDEKRAWCQNYLTTVGPIALQLGLDATPSTAGATNWLTADEAETKAHATYTGTVKALQQQTPLSADAIRAFIRLLKATPGVTPEMLAALHAVGAETDPTGHRDAQQPTLTLSFSGGHVVIKFTKHGHQGILLDSRLDDETTWTRLGLDTHSPYIDTRPNRVPGQPETRHYRAYYADRDQPVGEVSAVFSIAVGG